jgi:perosamine synthetase
MNMQDVKQSDWHDLFIELVHQIYGSGAIPLHRPVFSNLEKQYLSECIDSNFVSSVGARVTEFEQKIAAFTGAKYAIATMNGTAALHAAIEAAGVRRGDEVISQAVTFIATCNALSYAGATPVFVDVDLDSMGMSPSALRSFLETNGLKRDGSVWNKNTGRRISACIPMHTFGLPCRIVEISEICAEWGIALIEDAAESLGSYVDGRHTGTFGKCGTLSFNGNKVITTGGGGMIITNDENVARRLKHLTTTAKVPHAFEFVHDEVGYNYRLPNLNAALGCAQVEKLKWMLEEKYTVAMKYHKFFSGLKISTAKPSQGCTTNYWLNAIVLSNKKERDDFLAYANSKGVMVRPIWRLMSELAMFKNCQHDGLEHSRWLEERVVNVPSSVPFDWSHCA